MISAIVRASLRFRLLIVGIAAGVLAVGIAQLRNGPIDVLPEFTPPYVEIQTEALGLSPEEVEQLITVPLEADLLNGVEGVDVIRSQSLPGLSSIVLVFTPGTGVFIETPQQRLQVRNVLDQLADPGELGKVPVEGTGGKLRLSDVADVKVD